MTEETEIKYKIRLEEMRQSMPWHQFINACKADDTMPNKIVNTAIVDMAEAINPAELEELSKRADSSKEVHAAIKIVRELTKKVATPPKDPQKDPPKH